MGKSWDKALPDINIWKDCLRVLKPGAFAFVMSIPRADCLSRMIISLEDAGFNVGFSPIYHAFSQGFPKAQNIGKAVDKRLGAEREVVGERIFPDGNTRPATFSTEGSNDGWKRPSHQNYTGNRTITQSASPQAKALDGSYAGAQMKPAVEVIIVAMKQLSEKTFIDQALKNGKGVTWLDDCRVPYDGKQPTGSGRVSQNIYGDYANDIKPPITPTSGRFPANLLVSDDVLNDGRVTKSAVTIQPNPRAIPNYNQHGDSGSFSRYFDLDKWFSEKLKQLPASVQKTFPFLLVPKASKSEKNKGLEGMPLGEPPASARSKPAEGRQSPLGNPRANTNPCVKPIKLMSYLITLGSREGDVVLDPFLGSGTTALACQMLGRQYIGIEISPEYAEIAEKRCQSVMRLEI